MSRKRKSPTSKDADTDEIIQQLKKQLKEAETRAREAEARAIIAETRAIKAETRAREAEARAIIAEQRLNFIIGINNNSITTRDSLILAIEAAKFEDKLDEVNGKILCK